jgi:uncharacterized membrane protein
MMKKAEQNKISDNTGVMLEHHTLIDDNLLPSADELIKLKGVSEDIVPWMMERAEKEQDARIKFNEDRIKIAQSDFKHMHLYSLTALIMAFIIVLLFIGFSFYLIMNGSETVGTVFAGGAIVLIVSYFLKAKHKETE